jgi:DNA-binding response OmpR family regulator
LQIADCAGLIRHEEHEGHEAGHLLNRRGRRARGGFGSRAALNLAQQANPDLIILDLGLPDMDGLDVCREIRQASTVPIVILTRRNTEPDYQHGLAAGANAYITKPFDANDLQTTVRSLLHDAAPQID